jgi:hypothetical protein
MKKPADFESLMRSLYGEAVIHETLTFPLRDLWESTRSYWRTLFRHRVMWVRNWHATPMIVDSKAKWVLSYERRRFLRWIAVQAAVVDTLDECRALVKHRRQEPVKFPFDNDTGMTWNFNCKVNFNAPDELRPKGADHGAAAASGVGEVRTQAAEETQHGQAEGGNSSQEQVADEREGRTTEEIAGEVSGHSAEILDRRDR